MLVAPNLAQVVLHVRARTSNATSRLPQHLQTNNAHKMVLRVIEDSDDDSDALSPVRSASMEVKGPTAATEMDGSESTGTYSKTSIVQQTDRTKIQCYSRKYTKSIAQRSTHLPMVFQVLRIPSLIRECRLHLSPLVVDLKEANPSTSRH